MSLDPNNQNYFALDAEPVVPVLPWWKVRRYQVQLGAIAGIILGVGVVGYYVYQTYTLTHVDRAAVDQANIILDGASQSCASAEDPAACEAAARADAARTTGQTSVCEGLVDEKYVTCVALIAFDQEDPKLCGVLTGEDQIACEDGAFLVRAKTKEDYAMCDEIKNEDFRLGCKAQLVGVVIANGQCEQYGIDAETCGFPALLNEVVTSGDPAGCAKFSSEQQASCVDIFSSTDADQDGLSLLEESKYGTSDQKADTDGDGYTDAQEIATGHDPLR